MEFYVYFNEVLNSLIIKFYQKFGIYDKVTWMMLEGLIIVIPKTGKYN